VSFRVVLFFLWLAAAQALAQSEVAATGPALLDFEHPPQALVKMLPEQVAQVARVECSPSAQTIVAHDGWSWRYPGTYLSRPSIPAELPLDSRDREGSRYFTEFTATELTAADAIKHHETFVKNLPTYWETAPPARLVKLVAHNDLGHKFDAYFGFRSDGEGWVALCAPECAPEYVFLMKKID
jgi:hypothetical protein